MTYIQYAQVIVTYRADISHNSIKRYFTYPTFDPLKLYNSGSRDTITKYDLEDFCHPTKKPWTH